MADKISTYAMLMPKIKLAPIKQKTKQEEVKEIIQSPDDPLSKYPLRGFGYSNEIGAAVSTMPVWGKAAETALWIPALMYFGADIYDKYSRGKEGNYTQASTTAALKQTIFQALASVILPTAAVKVGQRAASNLTRLDGSGLSASAKEEMLDRLLDEFDNSNFAKGDIERDGKLVKGVDRVKERVIEEKLKPALVSTRSDLKTEGFFPKLVRFFAHSKRPVASATSEHKKVIAFVEKEIEAIFEKQTLLENSTKQELEKLGNNKLLKLYNKAEKNAVKRAQNLIEQKPELVIKKILNSSNSQYQPLKDAINAEYDTVVAKKLLVKQEVASEKMLKKLMENDEYRKLVNQLSEKVEISRKVLRQLIKSKSMSLGLLKTVGGFIALGCLAVPIDHFVHKYIIKKFVEPGLDTVSSLSKKSLFK